MSRYYPEGTTAQDIDDIGPSRKDERIQERAAELLAERVADPEWLSDHMEWVVYREGPTRNRYEANKQQQALELMQAIELQWTEPDDAILAGIGAMVVNNTIESLQIECEQAAEREIEAEAENAEEAAREGGYYRRAQA